jgi:hypothetical protein
MKPKRKAPIKKSPLESKSSQSYQIAVQLQLEKQTPENATLVTTDDFGNTPLHYLALYGWLESVDCKKIPVSAWLSKNKSKVTPVQYVRRSQFHCLPQSRQIEKALGPRGAKYWASQAQAALGEEKPGISNIELF